MNTITHKQLHDQLNWRYATKQFDPIKKISLEDWQALEETLVLTPTSFGLQPSIFMVINDPQLRAKLQSASWGQPQIIEASHLVVFIAKSNYSEADLDAYINRVVQVRGINPADMEAAREMMFNSIIKGMTDEQRKAWAINQTYIALGNLLTSAALLGIDACPMEGFVREEYDSILGLTEQNLASAVVAGFGYRSSSDKYANLRKVRLPQNQLIVHA